MNSAHPGRPPLTEWFWLARPFTLTAAAVPVLFGTALALSDGAFAWGPFLAMLVASLLIQAATNMFNEFYDEKRGLDTAEAVGIAGSIVQGRVHARAVLLGPCSATRSRPCSGCTSSSSGAGHPGPRAALGAGRLPVLRRAAPHRLHGGQRGRRLPVHGRPHRGHRLRGPGRRPPVARPLAALPIGGLVAAILLANNIRDMESDRRGGRRTLPIVFGRSGGILVYRALLLEAYVAVAALISFGVVPLGAALAVVSALLLPGLWRGIAASRARTSWTPS
ncbi:hypothetical protein GBA65_16955 [Rubrobacter marinus]|uniref:1,4-dihydroxy-2-naphthoate octaprenyltransferase n=1 Tax=Rubrobacter marinus TaxID=2653852 RepID=A0A6G8Q0D9_9ACTN|nr:UbiA family prenyltransferase [Rubrobacter marinus]QIN79933.1 hypothetical protein GBA65_16955 [Rubrobacter marinus]